MSDIGGMVEELIAAGTPPGLAAQIVARAFAAGVSSAPIRDNPRDERDERRRETDRLRQQRWRDRNAMSRDNRDNPRDVTNASLSKEEKIESKIQEREAPQRAVRGNRLTEDWAPNAADWQAAIEAIGPDRSKSELAKFRDHWKQQPGSKGVKLDWNAAWRNWIRRAAEYRGGLNGNGNHNSARRSASADFFAGIASVAADIAGDDQPPRDAAPEVPLGRFNIDG